MPGMTALVCVSWGPKPQRAFGKEHLGFLHGFVAVPADMRSCDQVGVITGILYQGQASLHLPELPRQAGKPLVCLMSLELYLREFLP